jgi:hypothetical protein
VQKPPLELKVKKRKPPVKKPITPGEPNENPHPNSGNTKIIACIVHMERKIDSTLKLLRAGLEVGLATLPNPPS